MSLLLDALKRAELAKRQQAAGVEPEVYPSLALQGDELVRDTPSQVQPEVSSANAETAPESAFAAGLALEPVERVADVSPANELSLPERVSVATAAPVAPMPIASETAEPPIAITHEPENTEAANPASERAHEPEAEPPVLRAAVAASPSAVASQPVPSSPLASRFGAVAKPAAEASAPEVASAHAAGAPPVGSIPLAAAVAATPDAAKRVMINKPARKPINRSVWLALGGVLLLAASAGYVWWQMQPPGFNPDPALASDPLAASMADAGAAGNGVASAPPPAATSVTGAAAISRDAQPANKVPPAAITPAAPAVNPTPTTAALSTDRPSKRLEIRHDAPEEAVDETVQAGYKAYQSGDLASARVAYLRALQANPRERDALLGLAAVAARQGKPDEAERLYRKQLDYDPLDEVAKAGLTGISKGMGVREREAALRNLGEQPASSAQTAVQLGNLYASEKRWNEAQQQYFRALTLEPASPDHAFNLAISLEHLDQPRLALEYYQKAQTLAAQRKPGFDPAELKTRIEALSQP